MHRRTIIGLMPAKLKLAVVLLSICLLIIILTSFLAACSSPASTAEITQDRTTSDADVPPASPAGDISPDFTGVDVMTNETVSLSQFKGSTVLLNFVNYGCNSRLNQIVGDQLVIIRSLKEQHGDVVPVSVFCGCCPPEVLRDFAEQNDLNWPWILDVDNSIVPLYYDYLRDYGYPTIVLIDQDQYVREVAGYTDLSTLNAMLDGLSLY
ncbi:MAG: redoxin domain-containing protein [Dehalococcoidia bacterium]|nr:MAG: redoxin domain-containing protein [Dehalococcoidia bacterium]